MQKLQLDVSKYMGMAALLCETAGWWPLATVYTIMSQIAAAGEAGNFLECSFWGTSIWQAAGAAL
jgi:hypothetical protein